MPIDVTIAWRNIWRNPRRSILTMGAVAFATLLLVFMLSWQFGSYATMIDSSVKIQTGHLQIQAKGYNESTDIQLVVPNPEEIASLLETIPHIAAYASRASAFSLASSNKRTYGAMVVGIQPGREAGVSTLKSIVREGDFLAPDDTDSALIGSLLAQNLRAGIGDELVLLGQGRDASIAATVVRIKGIYSSGQDEYDRGVVHIPLATFQDVYYMRGAVHRMVIVADSLEDVAEVRDAVASSLYTLPGTKDLVVLDWKALMPGLFQAIQMDLVSGFIFYLILIVVVAFSIMNTFLMAILERTREFGVMMAIGTTPRRLTMLLLFESTTIAVIGTLAGVVLGSLLTWYFQVHGIVISGAAELMSQYGLPERMFPQLSLLSVSIGAGVVLIITLFTALYPALKVRRLTPLEAMSAT